MKKLIAFTVFFIFLFSFNPIITFAQPPDPCPDPDLADCPIDSNVYFLIIGAIAIAAKKTYDYKKKQLLA